MMLKLLPPITDATKPAQMAVMIPTVGVDPEATASDMDSGMDTSATAKPDFQFCRIFENIFFRISKKTYLFNPLRRNSKNRFLAITNRHLQGFAWVCVLL